MMLAQMPQGLNPLTPEQSRQFAELAGSLDPIQQAWISGYLAASAQGAAAAVPVVAPAAEPATLTILYGSQTGNAKHVATDLEVAAKARGLDVRLVNMADYKPSQLKNEKFLTIVVSTYGEGEPPEPAEKLHAFLASKKAPKLDGVQVAVLGLGDSSYEFFCQTAIDFEARLTALGASVLMERALLDVDFDDHAPDWIGTALDRFEPELKAKAQAEPTNVVAMPGLAQTAGATSQYSRKTPFSAEVSVVQKITGRDSSRDVRHVEISLEGSDLTYQPGDSLGLFFQNDPVEVEALLALLGLDGDAEVIVAGAAKSLRTALIEDLELTQSYPAFIEKYAAATDNSALLDLARNKQALRDYLGERQIFDVLREHPGALEPQALVDALRRMQPRLYSIASSQAEVEDEVHLTVGVVEWNAFDRAHFGGCSGHLGRRAGEGDRLRVFVESNDAFRLPADPNTPVIMIGPGTGIAPFRAFLQERDAHGSEGRNWLFFGNPNFTQDFLYQVELQGYLKSGLLDRLDVAFSRDQAEKIYVQDRILERGAEVFKWIEEGAHLYVCGDANRMAKDVHSALVEVVRRQGNMEADSAEEYLANLRDARRYQRDVY
ncbi:assimilatory sulfite reductase (NADPH) flavoprotein subunit [Amaricoccus macauensis]|uniref:assimilatory sulfite reductase (NADPH) flavoprotein subunit n=1 Tax=Amaricoccus macauensis TaxID=57001 RepID=UPI003C7B9424